MELNETKYKLPHYLRGQTMLWYVHIVKYNLNTTMVQIYAEKDITSVQLNIFSRNCTLLYLMTKQFRITSFYYCRQTISTCPT